MDPALAPIASEVIRVGARYERYGDRNDRWRQVWTATNYLLGAPAAVLAGISGAVGLNSPEHHVAAGVLALASAALGALLGFLKPSLLAAEAHRRAVSYWRVSNRARLILTLFLDDPGRARAELYELKRLEVEVVDDVASRTLPVRSEAAMAKKPQ